MPHYVTESEQEAISAMLLARYLPKKAEDKPVNDRIDLTIMQKYVDQKYVRKNTYVTDDGTDIHLFNYPPKCT